MDINQALNQPAPGGTNTLTEGVEPGPGIPGEGGSTHDGGQGSGLGVEVPPELQAKEKELMRAFHAKTQELAQKERDLMGQVSTYKQDAQALYELSKQDWFKQAVEAEKARRSGQHLDLTPEAFETIKNDHKAFADFLAKRDQAVAERVKQQFAPELQKLGKSTQEMLAIREFDTVAGKYGDDFVSANKDKLLDPYLDKGLDYETAYKLYCQDNGRVAGQKPKPNAGPDLSADRARAGAVERGGMSTVRGGPVVKAGNLREALDRAFELASKGVKDYRFER